MNTKKSDDCSQNLSEEEIDQELLQSDFAKPIMMGSLDTSLITIKESRIMNKNSDKHFKIVRKRAEQLRFYPDTLTQKERIATFRCLSYEELKPFYKVGALIDKNNRLQKNLSMEEKMEVRFYVFMLHHFSKSMVWSMDPDDVAIAFFTFRYFEIMSEHEEKVYEKPFYYISEKQKKRVLKADEKFNEKYHTNN